ncbi:MAG: LytR C-terminal domain-containing protein [Pseudonocardiaceae bacterium]
MSTPNGTGSSGRRRTAGLSLVGLAVVAVLIGVVAVTCRQQSVQSGPPLVAPSRAPGSGSATPSVITYPPPVTSAPAAAPEVTAPGLPEPTPGAPASGQGQAQGEKGDNRTDVRVYNNSTIRSLAARAAGDLTAQGWTVVDVGNYPWGTIPTTTVYYQEGTGQRADAESIGANFGMRVLPRFPGIANASPGLVVIVTNDYHR